MNALSYLFFGWSFGYVFGFCLSKWLKILTYIWVFLIALWFIFIVFFNNGEFISDSPYWLGLFLESIGMISGSIMGYFTGEGTK